MSGVTSAVPLQETGSTSDSSAMSDGPEHDVSMPHRPAPDDSSSDADEIDYKHDASASQEQSDAYFQRFQRQKQVVTRIPVLVESLPCCLLLHLFSLCSVPCVLLEEGSEESCCRRPVFWPWCQQL